MALYSSVQPLSQRSDGKYLPSDTIDFQLDFAGREIDPASIRISGELHVTTDAAGLVPFDGDTNIFLDPKVGAHGIFQQYITSLPDSGVVVENFQNVPRWVAMQEASTESKVSTGSTLEKVIELKTATPAQSRVALGVSGEKVTASFSIKPFCALTHATGNISYSRTGTIKLTCLMSGVNQLLWGEAVNANTSYHLKNLQLDYMSDVDTNQPLTMLKVSSLKQTLSSSNQQLSVIMPISSSSVTMSFIRLVDENTPAVNYTELTTVPDVSRVEFSFNDIVSGAFITYALENKEEILYNALLSMDSTGKFDLTQEFFDIVKGFGNNYMIGTLFGNVALSQNTKVGVNVQSSVQGNNAHAVYLYFRGLMQL